MNSIFQNKKFKLFWSISILLAILLCCPFNETTAQKPVAPPPSDTTQIDTSSDNIIHIRYADELNYLATGEDTIQKLIGHVEMNQDTLFLFCDSSTILNSVDMVAQGNFIMQQGDSMTIFADSAEYSSETKIADLYSDVSMIKGRQKLFTEKLTYDASTKIATYLTGATLTDDTTFLRSTRGYFHAKTDDIFFRDSVVVVNPDFNLRSDTLQFNARTKIVTFLAPTLIIQDTARIYTESGTYNINEKYAEFNTNPQYVKNDQRAWATRMTYNGKTEEIILMGNAHFEDSLSVATADIIRHNERTGVTILEGNAFFNDKDRELTGDTIFYDAKNETYSTRGRSHIVDGEQVLDADQVDYIKEKEMGIAFGNVVFTDTIEKMTVICEYAEHSKKRNFLKAFGGKDSLGNATSRPLMIKEVDGDSLFISADTLISYVPSDSSDLVFGGQPAPDSLQQQTDDESLSKSAENTLDSLVNSSDNQVDSINQDTLSVLEIANKDSLTLDSNVVEIKQAPIDTIPADIEKELDSTEEEIAEILDKPKVDSIPPNDEIDTPLLDLLDETVAEEESDTPLLDLLNETVAEEESDTPLLDLLDDLPDDSTEVTESPKEEEEEEEEERVILAFNDVRIFKKDLQALSDSMSYSSLDSMFKLYKEPIIWSDTSQFTADHVKIQMANNAIDKIYLEDNAFIINTPDEVFFNQIKGRNAVAYFDSSEIDYVKVVGNAESVYYAFDDVDAYIGVNKTVCSEMKILFGSNEVEGIVFYSQPTANLFPMREADHSGLQMEGFSWQIERRPTSVDDLLKIKKRMTVASRPVVEKEEAVEEKTEEVIETKEE